MTPKCSDGTYSYPPLPLGLRFLGNWHLVLAGVGAVLKQGFQRADDKALFAPV
jgi:hypothetical protein